MYRILIACVLAIQVQSRPFGTFFFGGRATPILPWLQSSPSPIASSQPYPASGIFDTIRIHQNVFSPFSRYLSSVNTLRQAPPYPPRIYGRLETPQPLVYQHFYGPPSTAPSFIPSNGFNPSDQHNDFAPSPNYQFPVDSFGPNNGPQFAPPPPPSPYAGTPAPVYGQPHPVYGPPSPNTFNAGNEIVNRFEPSNPNFIPSSQIPFQLQPGPQLPVAPFATNVLPIVPHISSPGTTYLPPATVNQKDSTQKVDTLPVTTPTTTDSETNANEPAAQTDSTKLPAVVRDGTQDGTSVSNGISEVATTESSIESTSPVSTTVQLSESSVENSSSSTDSTDAESTDALESTAISNKTTPESTSSESSSIEPSSTEPSSTEPSSTEPSSTESSSTEPSSAEPSSTDLSTDDESNAV